MNHFAEMIAISEGLLVFFCRGHECADNTGVPRQDTSGEKAPHFLLSLPRRRVGS